MVKKKLLNGEFKPEPSNIIPSKTIQNLIKQAYLEGMTETDILIYFNINSRIFHFICYKTIENIKEPIITENLIYFGNKKQAYYTEEEMIRGIPDYKFEDLTKTELKFYRNYNRQNEKKRHY